MNPILIGNATGKGAGITLSLTIDDDYTLVLLFAFGGDSHYNVSIHNGEIIKLVNVSDNNARISTGVITKMNNVSKGTVVSALTQFESALIAVGFK